MSIFTNVIPSAKWAVRLAIPAMALSVAPVASATELYRGTINLPMEAHWNDAVLKPGAYRISVESDFHGTQYIHIRNRAGDKYLMTGAAGREAPSTGSRLTIVNVGGAYVVKQFDAGRMGKSFSFKTPKGLSNESIRGSADTPTAIAVAANR